eukprot:Em0002g1310a
MQSGEGRGVKRPRVSDSAYDERPSVKIVVTHQDYVKRYTLTPSRREIGRSLGRKLTHSFARYVMENTEAEMKALYSEQALLNNDLNIATLSTFTWDRLSLILHQKAPVLLGFLNSCIPRGSKRRKPILVVCIAILINSHRRTTVIQAIASVILNLGHAGKQVYTRLQQFGICLSSYGTRHVVEKLGVDHDSAVLQWMEHLLPSTPTVQENYSIQGHYYSESADSTLSSTNICTMLVDDNASPHRRLSPLHESTPRVSTVSSSDEEELLHSPTSPSISLFSEDKSVDVTSDVVPSTPSMSENHTPVQFLDGSTPPWFGFRLVGDNIDKSIKPRDMRLSNQSNLLHYFNVYAVRDRIDFHDLEGTAQLIDPGAVDFSKFFPTAGDGSVLLANFQVLMMRILAQHIPGVQDLSVDVKDHIDHQYSKEMCRKSEVVPIGVFLKNENKLDDMSEILDELHKYVPMIRTTQVVEISGPGETTRPITIHTDHFNHILIGGDQLTVARVRGCQRVKANSHTGRSRYVHMHRLHIDARLIDE